MLNQCAICQNVIWHTEGGLCAEHRAFADLWSLIEVGAFSDWRDGLVSHKTMQTTQPVMAIVSWRLIVADINRMARSWLDGWGDGAVA